MKELDEKLDLLYYKLTKINEKIKKIDAVSKQCPFPVELCLNEDLDEYFHIHKQRFCLKNVNFNKPFCECSAELRLKYHNKLEEFEKKITETLSKYLDN